MALGWLAVLALLLLVVVHLRRAFTSNSGLTITPEGLSMTSWAGVLAWSEILSAQEVTENSTKQIELELTPAEAERQLSANFYILTREQESICRVLPEVGCLLTLREVRGRPRPARGPCRSTERRYTLGVRRLRRGAQPSRRTTTCDPTNPTRAVTRWDAQMVVPMIAATRRRPLASSPTIPSTVPMRATSACGSDVSNPTN